MPYPTGPNPTPPGDPNSWWAQNGYPGWAGARQGGSSAGQPLYWNDPASAHGPMGIATEEPVETEEPVVPTTGTGDNEITGTIDTSVPPYMGPARPTFNFPGVPTFEGIPDWVPPSFNYPTPEGVFSDPSYQFRRDEGLAAVQASAAAKGVLNTGQTFRSLSDYGQAAASQELQAIFGRAAQAYGLDYTASKEAWDRAYGQSRDKFAPELLEWSSLFGAEENAGMSAFQRAWQAYSWPIEMQRQMQQYLLGLGASTIGDD